MALTTSGSLGLARFGALLLVAAFPALRLAAAAKGPPPDFPIPFIPSQSELAAVDQLLKAGEGQKAFDSLQELVRRNRETPRAFGLGTAVGRLAVAEAILGREEEARWHWAVAQGLIPGLGESGDLKGLGDAGAKVAAWPVRSLTEVPSGVAPLGPAAGDFQPPRQKSGTVPDMGAGIRVEPGPKWLQVQLIVEADGRPRDPIAHGPSDRFAFEVLEALRTWRFEPAQRGGVAVPALYLLTINAPRGTPLAGMLGSFPELQTLEARLRTGVDAALARQVEDLWRKSLDRGSFPYDVQAALLTLRSLAWVATGRESEGICLAQAAQGLSPSLFDADLSPYGTAGAILERNRFGAARAARPPRAGSQSLGQKVEKPTLISQKKPEYTERARRGFLVGDIQVSSIIDESGAMRDPLVFGAGPESQGLDFISLESFCQWRFAPARRAGSPIPVLYDLTMHFAVSR